MATIESVTTAAAAAAANETQRSSVATGQPALPTTTPAAPGSAMSGLLARSRARLNKHASQNAGSVAGAAQSLGMEGRAMEMMLFEQAQRQLTLIEGMVTASTEFANTIGRDLANSAR